jgi:hypothetical protein
VVWVFALVFFLWTFSSLQAIVAPTLDGSWQLALNWAQASGLQWGRDIMFTYGPLFWAHNLIFPPLFPLPAVLYVILLFNLAATACATYLFAKFRAMAAGSRGALFLFPVALSLLVWNVRYTGVELFMTAALCLFVSHIHKQMCQPRPDGFSESLLPLGPVVLVLAASPLVKFSYFPVSLSLAALMLLALLFLRKFREAGALVVAYPLTFVVLWGLMDQSPLNLPQYIRWGLSLAGGYTEAMQSDFQTASIYQAFIFTLLLGFVYALAGIRYLLRRQFAAAFAWWLPLPLLFSLFKQGFVRADGHAHIIFMCLPILLVYLLFATRLHWPARSVAGTPSVSYGVLGVMLLTFAASHTLFNQSYLPANQFREYADLAAGDLTPSQTVRWELSAKYALEEPLLAQIRMDESIDIVPHDIALLYAYGLDWSPRPIIQSYATFQPELDAANAGHFLSSGAPPQVLWEVKSIDNRYAPFDDPQVFRALLDRYQFTAEESSLRYALLRLNPQAAARPLEALGPAETHRFNDVIPIPAAERSHLYLNVRISPTPWGGLLNIVYKAPMLTLILRTRDGQSYTHRFLRSNGGSGLFVSKYLIDADDLRMVLQEAYEADIVSVQFLADPACYAEPFSVQFFQVPFRPA